MRVAPRRLNRPARFLGTHALACLALLAGICLLATAASAQTLSFLVQTPSPLVLPGDTFVFQGTVSNNTGGPLNATDLLFNFSGFDPNALTITQTLGTPDFLLNDGATSPVADLFSVSLDPAAPAGQIFPFDVSLQDSFGDQTAVGTFTVQNAAPVPESSYSLPCLLGLFAAVTLTRRAAKLRSRYSLRVRPDTSALR